MQRRDLLRLVMASAGMAGLGGCDLGSRVTAPGTVSSNDATWSGIFIPGYNPDQATPENEPADSRRRRQGAPQGTLLTRLAPDGTLRQAAFPIIGHDIAISPDRRIGFFGRMGHGTRGNTAHHVTFDPETLELISIGTPPGEDWRGGGHGVFLDDSHVLTAERAPMGPYSGQARDRFGRLSVRDPNTLREIDSLSCHGIDPHEIRLTPDKRQAIIANYGSVPAAGSDRLSAPRHVVDASLTVVDLASGALVEKFVTADPEMELRHLALGDAGKVFGIRARLAPTGADASLQARLGEQDPDLTAEKGLSYLDAPPLLFDADNGTARDLAREVQRGGLRHGLSVEHDPTHDEFLATFPSSHRLLVFDGQTGDLKQSIDTRRLGLRYPCGLALLPGSPFYAVAGHWENVLVLRRGRHRPERALSRSPVLYGHSHMTAV